MTKVRIDKWPVTGLAKGSLNGKPFALAVGRVVDTTPAIAALLKEVSGAKVKVFKDNEPDAPAEQPEPLVLNSEEVKAPVSPAADPKPDEADPEAEALAKAEAKATERERVKAEKAAAKAAAAAEKKAAKKK